MTLTRHELLEADEPFPDALLDILHNRGFGPVGRRDAVEPGVDDPADHVEDLDIHAVRMQMSADAVAPPRPSGGDRQARGRKTSAGSGWRDRRSAG